MEPIRKAQTSRYWVFRGETRGGHQVAWGTTAADCLPVMVEPPQTYSLGPSLAVGEPPPAVATGISLADPDGEIATLVLSDRRGRQGVAGKLYVGEIEGGVATESPASPTLYAVGNASHQDGITSISLQSDDSRILGRSVALWTVKQILEGHYDTNRDPVFLDASSSLGFAEWGKTVQDALGEAAGVAQGNLGAVVPWAYGPTVTESIPVVDSYPRVWIDSVRGLDSVQEIGVHLEGEVSVLQERDGALFAPDRLGMRTFLHLPLGVDVPMVLEDQDGDPREVWVRILFQPAPPEEEGFSSRVAVVQSAGDRAAGTPEIAFNSPPAIIAQVVRDHSPAGIGGLHWPAWERAIEAADPLYGDACGGVFGSEGTSISEIIQHLAPVCGLRVWLGTDDKLHAALSGYTFEDQETAKGDLLEVVEGDVFPRDASGSPSMTSEIVGDPDDDAAGVARVSIDWTELQREVYPIETSSTLPTVGEGADDAERERVLSGAWIYPPRGADVAIAIMSSMSGDAARAQLATHISVRDVGVHQLVRVSHPSGLGLPGRGWVRRLTRVDGVEVMPGEDAVRLTLTDLGLSERMRLGLLDTVEEWILYAAKIPAEELTIEPYVDPNFYFISDLALIFPAPYELGLTIWTPGAAIPAYRRSWRAHHQEAGGVVVYADGLSATQTSSVDPVFDDAVLGAGWAVMRVDFFDPLYRQDFIRACDVNTGMFDSGHPGFQWSAL